MNNVGTVGAASFNQLAGDAVAMLGSARAALLVVDVQNDFAHPEGKMGLLGVDLSRVDAVVARINAMIAAARAQGVPVILVRLETTPERDSRAAGLRRERKGHAVTEAGRLCRSGTWGQDFYGIIPAPGDIHIAKWRYSSFGGTGLDMQLRALGIDTLVVCGLTTECCVETTVRDGFALDYHVFVPQDSATAYQADMHDAALRSMALNFALIIDSAQVVQAWAVSQTK